MCIKPSTSTCRLSKQPEWLRMYDFWLCKPKFVDAKYDSENCTVYVHSTAIVMYRLAIAVNNHAIHKRWWGKRYDVCICTCRTANCYMRLDYKPFRVFCFLPPWRRYEIKPTNGMYFWGLVASSPISNICHTKYSTASRTNAKKTLLDTLCCTKYCHRSASPPYSGLTLSAQTIDPRPMTAPVMPMMGAYPGNLAAFGSASAVVPLLPAGCSRRARYGTKKMLVRNCRIQDRSDK